VGPCVVEQSGAYILGAVLWCIPIVVGMSQICRWMHDAGANRGHRWQCYGHV